MCELSLRGLIVRIRVTAHGALSAMLGESSVRSGDSIGRDAMRRSRVKRLQ